MRKIVGFIPLTILVLAIWFNPPGIKNDESSAHDQSMNSKLDKIVQDLMRLEAAKQGPTESKTNEGLDYRAIGEFWGSIYQAYDYLRLRDVSFRYPFLYRVVELWATKTGDELFTGLRQWHKREVERDMLEYEVSQKEWDKRLESISSSIDRLKSESNDKKIEVEVSAYPVVLQAIISDVKSLSESLTAKQITNRVSSAKTLIDLNDAKHVFILTVLSLVIGLGLHYFLNPIKKTQSAIGKQIPAPTLTEAERKTHSIPKPKIPPGAVDVEALLADVIRDNQHILKAGNIKLEKMISDVDLPWIAVDEKMLKDGLQNFFMGSIGLVDASHSKASIAITPVCKIVEQRLNLSFKIIGASIDEQTIERNTLALADSASPILFASAEKTLRMYQPIISVSAQSNEAYINLQMG